MMSLAEVISITFIFGLFCFCGGFFLRGKLLKSPFPNDWQPTFQDWLPNPELYRSRDAEKMP